MAQLAEHGVEVLQFDVATLEETEYRLTGAELTVIDGDRELVARKDRRPVRGWIRRLAPPHWRRYDAPASHGGAVRASWVALLVGIARALPVTWLTDLERLFVAENKLVQQAAARELGISVPQSVVTSGRANVDPQLGERLVVKPLGPSQFVDEGVAQVLFARELGRDAAELDALGGAPFLIQERLAAEQHLRVVTVRDRVWVCRLDAREVPLDWRRVDEAHDSFVVSDEHANVAAAARRLAARLTVGYSSQDWLVAGGRAYFLDLNPGGQWLFLPEPVASAVTAEIAAWLTGNNAADASRTR